ncbi:PREDICTED: uncharacterized protein LOC105578646 [Cercocebus atys]|uniref:uncharacterized protein LOC105578646 n=1 Tax=Cercocebus atys TaxID=9531 RepID=UPI0005F3A97E|nr:PREDICTED: uncharacterized protein LOC105578646 [Cercocebus atys]
MPGWRWALVPRRAATARARSGCQTVEPRCPPAGKATGSGFGRSGLRLRASVFSSTRCGRGQLPKEGPRREGPGVGLGLRLLGASGLRLRRRGPMARRGGCRRPAPRLLLGRPGPGAKGWLLGSPESAGPRASQEPVLGRSPRRSRSNRSLRPLHRRRFLKPESSDFQWLTLERPLRRATAATQRRLLKTRKQTHRECDNPMSCLRPSQELSTNTLRSQFNCVNFNC